ncbi:MAG: hypothetical protein P4N41_13170 [Negativicutes bacterium]|nr:hypothetical protein [Negativicutes bacterium]
MDNPKKIVEELLDEIVLDEKKRKEMLQQETQERLNDLMSEYISKD